MINLSKCNISSFAVLFALCSMSLNAQIFDLEISIEPELTIEVQQDLQFGTVVSNSGINTINLNDVNLGIFSIRAFYTETLSVEITHSDNLENLDPLITDSIPIDLRINYNNINDNPNQSIPLPNNSGTISMTNYLGEIGDIPNWKEIYIFVHGFINVGNVADGNYIGEAALTVNYN